MADIVGARIYLVLSDIHVPCQDERAIQIACDMMRDLRPHGLVLNGDILDLPEVSRHNAGSVGHLEGKRISQTFTAGNKLLDQLDAAAGPRCKEKHFIFGNHEHRWARWLMSGDNIVFADDDAMDFGVRLKLRERGYLCHKNYPEAHVRIGKLLVTHGQWCGKYPAARHMERYQTSVLVGHTHTAQSFSASTWDGQRAAFCSGHMADAASEAMDYAPKPNNWITGFSVVYVEPSGNFHLHQISVVEGRAFYGGKLYPARARRNDARRQAAA